MAVTLAKSFGLGDRYAAPMQKRVAPEVFAARARPVTSSSSIKSSAASPVSYRTLCGQYAQSSGQAPVLMLSKVLTCTVFGAW